MARINEHYLKLQAGYLFPEIGRRVSAYMEGHPTEAKRIIRCGIGDVTEPLPQAAITAIKHAADELGDRDTFRGYPPFNGYEFAREAIAKNEYRDLGIEIANDEIFLSDGSKGDCGSILEILGNDNVIAVTDPVYPVYVDTNVMVGNTGSLVNGAYEGLQVLEGNEENGFIPEPPKEHIALVYLCFPNNPTGAMIDHAGLRRWVDWANEHNAIILYDAAYASFIRDESLPKSIYEIDGAKRCAIEFHSFSKNGGFTGVRAGYSVVPHELHGSTHSGEQISINGLWARRWSTRSNGVSWPVQRAVESLYSPEGKLQIQKLIEHYMGNADLLRRECLQLGMTVFGGENAPYVWTKCPEGIDSWGMFDRMLEELQIVVTPGAGFGPCGEGYFRISAFNSRENVIEVVNRMKNLFAS